MNSLGEDTRLQSLIGKTKFAISMEESRYTLNGGLLILKPDTIARVATDGHRLALAETKARGIRRVCNPS
jgi:DNA polymerase-3 subunit beta